MGRGKQATERPAQVEELAGRIEHWRETRTKRKRPPRDRGASSEDLIAMPVCRACLQTN
jgi:hypothetical protein